MKSKLHLISYLFFLLFVATADAQHAFSKVFYDSIYPGHAYALTPSFDNGEMVAGTMFGSGLVMKLDSAGSMVWSKLYDVDSLATGFYNIIQTADSGFVLVGSVWDSWVNADAICMKLNRAGDTLWTRRLGSAVNEEGISVEATLDGGFVIVGYTANPTLPHSKILLFKLDSAGNMVWNKSLAWGAIRNMGYSVKQTPDSGFVISGNMFDSFPNNPLSAFLVKFDVAGIVSWAKNYFSIGQTTEGMDVAVLPGGYVLYLTKNYNSALMKVDLNGNVEWINKFPDLVVNRPYGYSIPHARLIKTSDGGLAFVNGVLDYNHFGRYFLCKTDSNGNNAMGEQVILNALALHENADKSVSVAGNGPLYELRTTVVYPDHFGVFRTDSLWNNLCGWFYSPITSQPDVIDTLSINLTATVTGALSAAYPVISSILPQSDSGCIGLALHAQEISAEPLLSIYPNPASSEINFSFTQIASHFKLTILNTIGQEVYSKMLTGDEAKNFSMDADFPPGMYIVVLSDGRFVYSKKLVIE